MDTNDLYRYAFAVFSRHWIFSPWQVTYLSWRLKAMLSLFKLVFASHALRLLCYSASTLGPAPRTTRRFRLIDMRWGKSLRIRNNLLKSPARFSQLKWASSPTWSRLWSDSTFTSSRTHLLSLQKGTTSWRLVSKLRVAIGERIFYNDIKGRAAVILAPPCLCLVQGWLYDVASRFLLKSGQDGFPEV